MTESDGVRIPSPEPIRLRDRPLDNIRYFKRQWKYYCIYSGLNRLSEEKKVAAFFLLVGREALTFIHENLGLSDEEMNNCDRILDALEASHEPRTNVMHLRFLFYQMVQNDTDSIDQFVDRLRELADQCGFEDRLEEMVRDRFVVGLKNKRIQSELLATSNLSLANAVRLCKLNEPEELNNARLLNQRVERVENVPEISNRGHSSTLDVDARPAVRPVKEEQLDDDDDLIILGHYQADSVAASNRAAKRMKLEPSNGVDDGEEVRPPQMVDVESNQSKDVGLSFMKIGSFVVLKEDWNTLSDPPLWKIDSAALLQKFIAIEYNGLTLHKSTAVYSGWSGGVRKNYYKAPVEPRQSSRKETVVFFRKDLVPIENQFENVEDIVCKKSI